MNIRIFLWKNNVSEDEIYEIEKFFEQDETKKFLRENKIYFIFKLIPFLIILIIPFLIYIIEIKEIQAFFYTYYILMFILFFTLIKKFLYKIFYKQTINLKTNIFPNLQNFLRNNIIYEEKENKLFISGENENFLLDWYEFYEVRWYGKREKIIFEKKFDFRLKDYKEENFSLKIPSRIEMKIIFGICYILALLIILNILNLFYQRDIGTFIFTLGFSVLWIFLCIFRFNQLKKELKNLEYRRNENEKIDYSEEKKILVDFYLENKNIKTLTFSNNKLSLELYFSWGYTKYWVLHEYIFLKKVDDLIKRLKSVKHFSR